MYHSPDLTPIIFEKPSRGSPPYDKCCVCYEPFGKLPNLPRVSFLTPASDGTLSWTMELSHVKCAPESVATQIENGICYYYDRKCSCGLAGSEHNPWCDYFPGGKMERAPDGTAWDLWDNPIKIAKEHREKTDKALNAEYVEAATKAPRERCSSDNPYIISKRHNVHSCFEANLRALIKYLRSEAPTQELISLPGCKCANWQVTLH